MIGIYKITNKINNKVYIGQSVQIQIRWKRHQKNAKDNNQNTLLYKAMREYGIENFVFEVIEECKKEELNEREIYWIKYYNSFNNDYGYNMTSGGSGLVNVTPEEIYQLWDEGFTVKEITEKLKGKVCSATIRNYLHEYKNWSVYKSRHRSSIKAFEKKRIKLGKKYYFYGIIKQYDLFGNFLKDWSSKKEICETFNIPKITLSKVLKGEFKQSHGFQWKYGKEKDVTPIKNIINDIPIHFGVIQKDLNGNIIGHYKTVKEAAEAVHCCHSNISKVCKHLYGRTTAKGYIWEYDYSTWYDPN